MRCFAILSAVAFSFGAILISLSSFVSAAPAAEPVDTGVPSSGAMVVQILIALAIVSVSILALAWVVKRLGNTSFLQAKGIKIISSMPLGTREKLLVIEVENQKLLLGVTPHSINKIHQFSKTESDDADQIQEGDTSVSAFAGNEKLEFSSFIRKLLPENKSASKSEGGQE